jgi:hypothetical protein
MLLFVSLNSVQNAVYRIIEVVFPSNFLPVKMKVSCLATDGRHLGSGIRIYSVAWLQGKFEKSEPKILFCLPYELTASSVKVNANKSFYIQL